MAYYNVCEKAVAPFPDAEDFVNYLIDCRLAKLQSPRTFPIGDIAPYNLDASGVGDYIDDLCLTQFAIYNKGENDMYSDETVYWNMRLKLYADTITAGVYGEWKYLKVNNAGVPLEF